MYMDKSVVKRFAKKYHWNIEVSIDKTLLIFSRYDRGHQQVNVWFTTGTVGTSLKHPTKGKTQLFRRHVDYELLEKIFQNLRVHSDLGYYTK